MEKKLWFRAKRYGFGWYPVTWQGWGVLGMYVFTVITDAIATGNAFETPLTILFAFARLIILTTLLIIICNATGEPAKWRWGNKE